MFVHAAIYITLIDETEPRPGQEHDAGGPEYTEEYRIQGGYISATHD